tara:strand:- start:1411 stop:2925 length:1515 start_codon:yes stop_codon:yes gene_type:complete
MKNRNLYVLIGAIIFLGGLLYVNSDQDEGSNTKSLDLTTVKVQRGDLEKKEEYNGTIRQVDKSSIRSSLTGVVTYLPEEGSVINFGQVLYSVDGKPVVLLEGSIPFYRTLDLTSKDGPDIKQLEQSLIDMGYAQDSFVADETFDEETSDMLNSLYIDYGIETKAEITATEQIAINSKNAEVETIEEAISSGVTTLVQVQQKKKALDDAKENATKENSAWEAYQTEIEKLEDDIYELDYQALSDETRASRKEDYEAEIEEKKRLQDKEAGEGAVIDADEALTIETAQKAYDDALESYEDGAQQEANLEKAKEDLRDLELSSKSETFSPTNALSLKSPINVGSYVAKVGDAIVVASPLYASSGISREVTFNLPAGDQGMISVGDNVIVKLPTDEEIKAVVRFVDTVVTEINNGSKVIEVVLDVVDADDTQTYDEAPVDILVTSEVSEDVLYVPVNALVALAEGGYAIELLSGEEKSYISVEIGVFTDGYVEIIGNIQEGQEVIVPR